MAMILDALATYIQDMLMDMVKNEVHMMLGVPNEIERLKTTLTDLKRFLADADRRHITDETVGEWVKEFRGAMYDATDVLDLCQLKAMERGPSRDMGCFNPLLFCIKNPLHAHNLGECLKTLNENILDIGRRSKNFKFIELTSYEDLGRKKESSRLRSRETTVGLDKMGLVGKKIEHDTRNLVELLTTKDRTITEYKKVLVFAIVGVGGIGKTTLAKNIMNNVIIQKKFDKRIWLSVNQNFNEINLLERTITEAGGDHTTARNTKAALERILMATLKGRKTLLVMDDVWDHNAWEQLKHPLMASLARGSRVLITTRHNIVARRMMAEKPYYHVDKLEQEDAWSLLKKQVVRNKNDESRVEILKDVGIKIVAKCDGLPLAVKAIGGLLCQKKIRRNEWENVLNDCIWSISQTHKDLNDAIYLSYQDLPSSLKPCFLHFSLLPKNTVFSADGIVGMWISEGFVHSDSRDLEELGREYYDELILRNLIEPDDNYLDQSVCTMHDVIRSFAQYVAREEALVSHSSKVDIIIKLHSEKAIRRISVETNKSESQELEWASLQTHISLRTLLLVGPIKIKPGDSLVTFSNLRILYVKDSNFGALAESLIWLKHLRYLTINNTNTSMLPEDIGNKLSFLQYICVTCCGSLVKLPSSIRNLRHLRFLDISGSSITNVPKGFSDLINLRKLYGFPAYMDGDWCSLEELGPLSNLIVLTIVSLENISSSFVARKASLCEKAHLRFLRLCCSNNRDDVKLIEKQHIKVFEKLCPAVSLEDLHIDGYFGQKLPRWIMTLKSLRILRIKDLPYCTKFPGSLHQLPYLEYLEIQTAPLIKSVGPKLLQSHNHRHLSSAPENLFSAIELRVIECLGLTRIRNLPKTEILSILECPNMRVLEGMFALQTLMLVDYKMKTLPEYLQKVKPKKVLEIDCDVSLLTSIAIGKSGPEWNKFCHIQHVKAYAPDNVNNIKRRWYVKYTRDPFSFETNIGCSDIARARRKHLLFAYERTCPVEEKPTAGHASADKRQPLCQRFRCNAYRHLVWWLEKTCLHCCEADGIAVSSDQWTEAADIGACPKVYIELFPWKGTMWLC